LITLLVVLYQGEYCIDYSVGGLASGGSTVLITLLVVLYQGGYCIDYCWWPGIRGSTILITLLVALFVLGGVLY
jgi:hypothetical protein